MDISQYLDIFIDETAEHIQSLSDNIMALEQEPENADTINEIFRAAHSLKGMAGTMGFKRMQHLTHDMENVFQEIRNGNVKVNSDMIDILFECLSAVEEYLETVKSTSDEGTNDNEVLIKKLNNYLEQSEGGGDVAPAEDAALAEEAVTDEGKSEGGSSDAPFKSIEVEESNKSKLTEAADSGLKLYGCTVYIQSDCLLKAARAFLVFLTFIIVFLITKIVSISSMLASLMLIVSYFILGIKDIPLLVMISLMFVLIVYKHRSNIMRLIKGEENKIDFSKKEK